MSDDPEEITRPGLRARKVTLSQTKASNEKVATRLARARDSITMAYSHTINARQEMATGGEYVAAINICKGLAGLRDEVDRLLRLRGQKA